MAADPTITNAADANHNMKDDNLHTEAEAAIYLKVSIKTLQRRRRDGMIGFCRVSGWRGIRYRGSHLKAYLDACEVAAQNPPPPPPKPKYRLASRRAEENQRALMNILYGDGP